jgi:hypothetical protein
MASLGTNVRISIANEHRTLARKMFVDVLGCTAKKPRDDLDVYTFEDGSNLGAYVVGASGETLGPNDHMKAPWLEFRVDDPGATEQKLAEIGVRPFDYMDKSHTYFCPPCGPVFRLAKR